MVRSDLKCDVTCITPSIQQTVHCQNMGFGVLNSKAEDVNLFENYDVCMAIESFSHIREKYKFLKNVYDNCDKLVMLVNCSCVYQVNELFSMEIYTPEMLKEVVESTGWIIQEFKNTRTDNKSNYYWSNNMNDVPKSRHMKALESHNKNAIGCGDEWVKNNPVMLVVATKTNKVSTRKLEFGLRDYEFNSIFKNLGIGVEVSDRDECIIENLREIRSYINNNCLIEHPLKYGDCVTYGTVSVNIHPPCIRDYYDKYSGGSSEYLISFNRFESKDGDTFISEHTDDYYDKERKLKYTCIAYVDTGYSSGGEFFVKHNNETITIESKVGRVIKFSSNVLHGANPFSSDGSRVTVALAMY